MRIGYETKRELQEVCKEYNMYSDFNTKLTIRMAFKTACEKSYANVVIYYFDHRKKLLTKDLIKEGLEIAKANGSDEIVSLYYDYTGMVWYKGPYFVRAFCLPKFREKEEKTNFYLLLTLFTSFDILCLKQREPVLFGLLRRDL